MLKRLGESILSGVSFAIFFVLGLILAALSFLWYFVPKKERQWREDEDAEAARRVAEIKTILSTAREKRETETAVKVTEIERQKEEARSADSVALANAMLKDD